MARPKKQRKTELLQVRLTPREMELIRLKAAKADTTISEFVRGVVLHGGAKRPGARERGG